MATQAANTPPAGEDETAETEDTEAETVEDTEPAEPTDETEVEDDPDVEAEAAAAAKAAEKGDKPDEEAEEAEGEPKAVKDLTVEELTAQLPEDTLRRLGQKFANKTMAAARRAERSTAEANAEVTAQNKALTSELTTYKQFVDQIKASPMTALRRVFGAELTFKQFAELVAKGQDAEPAKVDPQVAELRRRLDEKERQEAERNREENVRRSQAAVAEALAKEPDRFDLVTTELGQAQLWDAIVAYNAKYGSVPDDKVFEMADVIEKRLEAQVSKSKKFSLAQRAKTGTPAATKPSAAVKGKTITNRSSSAAPSKREEKPETEAERDRRINREMREAGELAG